jgi:hypothetical protein
MRGFSSQYILAEKIRPVTKNAVDKTKIQTLIISSKKPPGPSDLMVVVK